MQNEIEQLRVGVFFNARPSQGGLYQYALTMLDCLSRFGKRHKYTLFRATLAPRPRVPASPHWENVALPERAIRSRMLLEGAWMTLARWRGAAMRGWIPPYRQIARYPLDVMLYVKPSIQTFLWPFPSVVPIHDLQHRLQPDFPEVSARGEFARREYLYQRSIPHARAILTDSLIGREDVIQLYGADPARVFALPYLAPTYLCTPVMASDQQRVRARYDLPASFFFYPAVFWQHKNHEGILRALSILCHRKSISPIMVFAGSRRGAYERLVRLAHDLGVDQQVRFLGFVPDEDLPSLYTLAQALVMPTFFGPTNIPVIEAWQLGCPVITSDIRGVREQVGDAGLLVDPRSPGAIADALERLRQDMPLRNELIQRGYRRVRQWTPEDFTVRLESILAASVGKPVSPVDHQSVRP